MDPFVPTFTDVIDGLEAFVAFTERPAQAQSTIRRSIEAALREILAAHEWQSMKKIYRVQLQGAQNAGQITYLSTSGAVPREVTLCGAVWPTDQFGNNWATDGVLRIGQYSIDCVIDNLISPTTAQLDANMYPATDFSTPTGYNLGLAKYPLPPEFAAGINAVERNAWFRNIIYQPWNDFVVYNKFPTFSGLVQYWSIGPDPKRYGIKAVYFYPCPQYSHEADLTIKAWRRPMNLSGKEVWNYQGTASVAANGTTVTGVGTAFDQRMVGAMIRFAPSGTTPPTGTAEKNPYMFQQSVTSVTNSTSLTISAPAPSALSGVGYRVADPCDIPIGVYDCFLRNCEMQIAQVCEPKRVKELQARYLTALQVAKTADNGQRSIMYVGQNTHVMNRLRDAKNRPWIN